MSLCTRRFVLAHDLHRAAAARCAQGRGRLVRDVREPRRPRAPEGADGHPGSGAPIGGERREEATRREEVGARIDESIALTQRGVERCERSDGPPAIALEERDLGPQQDEVGPHRSGHRIADRARLGHQSLRVAGASATDREVGAGCEAPCASRGLTQRLGERRRFDERILRLVVTTAAGEREDRG